MSWTRSPLMRLIALMASVSLVVIHWDRESAWFWVGVGLVALNVAGLLITRFGKSAASRDATSPYAG